MKGRTLFLDRDGVINVRKPDAYIKTIEEFKFTEGTLDAIRVFAGVFNRIVIVTNQQGIGKGLMTEEQLTELHSWMVKQIESAGGRIDAVYYCPHKRESRHFDRKPNIGMGLAAKREFPEINFRDSLMAGDMLSDMKFGRRLRMLTALIDPEAELARRYPKLVDYRFGSLAEMAGHLGGGHLGYA
ncbi:MAG: HAD family hydrolase [Bacteroidetes bacterium]|nr:HAD family hydrolase [Bacteroidota bacterium]MBU1717683.1 HAD family hydrolase [Bacteroidota bacterium]